MDMKYITGGMIKEKNTRIHVFQVFAGISRGKELNLMKR